MNTPNSKNYTNSHSVLYVKNPDYATNDLPVLIKEFLNEFSSPYLYEAAKKEFISSGLEEELFIELFEVLYSENMIIEYISGVN